MSQSHYWCTMHVDLSLPWQIHPTFIVLCWTRVHYWTAVDRFSRLWHDQIRDAPSHVTQLTKTARHVWSNQAGKPWWTVFSVCKLDIRNLVSVAVLSHRVTIRILVYHTLHDTQNTRQYYDLAVSMSLFNYCNVYQHLKVAHPLHTNWVVFNGKLSTSTCLQGCGLGLETYQRLGLVSRKNVDVSVSSNYVSCPRPIFGQIVQATLIKRTQFERALDAEGSEALTFSYLHSLNLAIIIFVNFAVFVLSWL